MSATDELRALLDDAGVEWADDSDAHTRRTWWRVSGVTYTAVEVVDKLRVSAYYPTPAQAVEATLGRGECHKLPASGENTCIVRNNSTRITMEFGYWRCSECGCECFEGARYCMGCGAKVVDA